MTSTRGLIALCGLLALTGLASRARAQTDFTLVAPSYARSFTNTLGGVGFDGVGANRTITLFDGTPVDLFVDTSGSRGFGGTPNSDPTVTFFGTVTTPLTLGGITHDVLFDFAVTPGGPTAGGPDFLAGSPVLYEFAFGTVTVTPIATDDSPIRFATFSFVTVPEPGTFALLGLGVLPLVGIIARRRKQS